MTAEKPAQLRLFVAIELPEAWRTALGDLQRRMQDALDGDSALEGMRVRWVRPEGIHLTLKFIGAVPAERLSVLEAQLAAAVPDTPGIRLSLGRAGSFSDRRAPRVIWAGVYAEPAEKLLRLAADIETWLSAAGVPRERRAFASHLTLGRLPQDLPEDTRRRIAAATTSVPLPSVAPFEVAAVSLMQSFLGPGGARYERLGHWPV